MNIKLHDGETQIREGKANTSTLIGGKGGNLILTNKRLIFLAHGMNLTQGGVSVELKNVMSVEPAFTFVIFMPIPIPNAMKIRTQEGKVHKFVVSKRKEWIAQISKAMNSSDVPVPEIPTPSRGNTASSNPSAT